MSVLAEASGAQLLPATGDLHQTVPSYVAYSCISADQRTKHPVYAELASRLHIREEAAA